VSGVELFIAVGPAKLLIGALGRSRLSYQVEKVTEWAEPTCSFEVNELLKGTIDIDGLTTPVNEKKRSIVPPPETDDIVVFWLSKKAPLVFVPACALPVTVKFPTVPANATGDAAGARS
jgi:hypothetical protein